MELLRRRRKPDSHPLDDSDYRSKNTDGLQLWSSTIRILLPVAALALLWGRRGLLMRFLLQFDKNCISVICPSFKEKQRLLQWINCYLPTTWLYNRQSPINFWKDGSLLCTLLNSIIPGACSNPHRHYRLPPSHGIALAYKHLGITPVFTDQDLTKNTLSAQEEQIWSDYIQRIRLAGEKASKFQLKYSSIYLAKGMGLVSGEENRKMYFYVYLNSSHSFTTNDIIINIRSPLNIYETLHIPSQCITKNIFRSLLTNKFTYYSYSQRLLLKPISNPAPFTKPNQNADVNKKIPITFIIEKERIKVVYIPQETGIYEVSIIANGFHLVGSPFAVSVSENTSGVTEHIEELNSLPMVTIKKTIKRRILSQVIDFLDNQLLHESEKISETFDETEKNIKVDYHDRNKKTSETQSTKTSPICEDHIEYEVTGYLESSVIPQRNSEKMPQNVFNLDKLVDKQCMKTNNYENIKKGLYSENCSKTIIDEGDNRNQSHTNKFEVNDYESIPESDRQENDRYTNDIDLHILNYLPQLKYEKSISCNELNKDSREFTPLSQSYQSLNDRDYCFHFQEKLSFWESKSNLKDLKPELKFLRSRRSLPNIFLDQHDRHFTPDTEGFFNRTEFRSKQEYWSFLSSQSINCVESTSPSLPNICYKPENKRNVKAKMKKFYENGDFKLRFKECREFWEKLSSQDCLHEYLYIIPKSLDDLYCSIERNPEITDKSDFDMNTKTFDHSVFEERKKYWETIGKQSAHNKGPYKTRSELGNERYEGSNNLFQNNINNKIRNNSENEFRNSIKSRPYSFDQVVLKNEYRLNLTDDFKRINSVRENMKIRFHKNRDFFRSRESSFT